MTDRDADWWEGRSYLLGVQYRTDANLTARQSIYAYQRPPSTCPKRRWIVRPCAVMKPSPTLGAATAHTLMNSPRRGHAGKTLGVDLSAGMLRSARARVPGVALVAADAALPLAGGGCDVTLAMHMLYHVPSPQAAVRELRRVTRRGGRVLVGLNGDDHLRELRDLMAAALADIGRAGIRPVRFERIGLDRGQASPSGVFATVARHDFASSLLVPGSEPIAEYVRSTVQAHSMLDAQPLVAAVTSRLNTRPVSILRIRTHSGCLVCS